LYDGIEETAFKRIAGGYVFESRNPWLFGPLHGYLVNEAQKAEMAGCIRDTLKRIKPYVFVAAGVLPLVLVAGIFWLVMFLFSIAMCGVSAAYSSYLMILRACENKCLSRRARSGGNGASTIGMAGTSPSGLILLNYSKPPGSLNLQIGLDAEAELAALSVAAEWAFAPS
jgi:hypothetical protein